MYRVQKTDKLRCCYEWVSCWRPNILIGLENMQQESFWKQQTSIKPYVHKNSSSLRYHISLTSTHTGERKVSWLLNLGLLKPGLAKFAISRTGIEVFPTFKRGYYEVARQVGYFSVRKALLQYPGTRRAFCAETPPKKSEYKHSEHSNGLQACRYMLNSFLQSQKVMKIDNSLYKLFIFQENYVYESVCHVVYM